MSDKPCPECGCVMEEWSKEIFMDNDTEESIYELNYECPCCEYTETTYED